MHIQNKFFSKCESGIKVKIFEHTSYWYIAAFSSGVSCVKKVKINSNDKYNKEIRFNVLKFLEIFSMEVKKSSRKEKIQYRMITNDSFIPKP